MAMPNPPKPVKRKRRAGNPGKKRLPEPVNVLSAATGVPKAPETLQETGQALWKRVWSAGHAWLSPDADSVLLTMLCEAADEREAIRAELEDTGRTFTTAKGYVAPHPLIGQLRTLEHQMTQWLSLLGFSPTDRARLGLAEVKALTGLTDLMQRRRSDIGR